MGPALCTPKQLLLPLYLSYLSPKLGTNGRSTDLKSLLRQFIQCCSGPPKDSRFVQPTTVYETPQAVSTCFDGSSSAVTHMAQHACATACSNWSTSLDCVRFLLLTSAEGSFGSCPSFCSVPFLCANSHGIDLRPACPRSFA